jgi:hypothetical protein
MKLVIWRSEVRFLFWKLDVESATYLSLKHAQLAEKLILQRVNPLLRPFCRVIWRQV